MVGHKLVRHHRRIVISMKKKNVVAICGSTRSKSINHSLIKAIADLSAAQLTITTYDTISLLPHFNTEDDNEHVGNAVIDFREKLTQAAGIIICTPEYAHGVPGTLKNAIDWTVSSSQFPGKPTMLITASTDGKYGHAALLQTLKAIEAKNIDNHQLLITFAKTKINLDGQITDEKTYDQVKEMLASFIETLD